MYDRGALEGETVILTGIPKTGEPERLIRHYGGKPASFPLINVKERIGLEDESFIQNLHSYDWLIFTSQNGVDAFSKKLDRHHVSVQDLLMHKIAAVGSETEKAIKRIGLKVDFMPSEYSADRFVSEFPQVADSLHRCLFLKGSLAKAAIRDGLIGEVDEWTVYETVKDLKNAKKLTSFMSGINHCTITFSSPSAVDVFASAVFPHVNIKDATIAAIGHVTEKALLDEGIFVHIKPEKYTMASMIEKIASMKG